MLNNFEVLLVTSKTMGAELKEHYTLIFAIFFFSLVKKGFLYLPLYSAFYFFSSYLLQWVFADLSNNVF